MPFCIWECVWFDVPPPVALKTPDVAQANMSWQISEVLVWFYCSCKLSPSQVQGRITLIILINFHDPLPIPTTILWGITRVFLEFWQLRPMGAFCTFNPHPTPCCGKSSTMEALWIFAFANFYRAVEYSVEEHRVPQGDCPTPPEQGTSSTLSKAHNYILSKEEAKHPRTPPLSPSFV